MKTLLHTCCGPCASACVPRLKEMDRAVTLLFANSNIDTRGEFEKRLREAEKLAAADGVQLVALPYDHDDWLKAVAAGYEREPEKGARCARCFRYNLGKAAAYAAAHGFDEFTTSLTVSPHKDSRTIFAAADGLAADAAFLAVDFKKREGFKLSTRRARELGLYRQAYCGCEFSRRPPVTWHLRHKAETASTNLDARAGVHGDVFSADYQTAGRGRLDHTWVSPPGTNLMMSAVVAVDGLEPEQVATLPLVAGLAVAKAVRTLLGAAQGAAVRLKWPNDVWVGGRKIAGILCERQGDAVIVGIGLNVGVREFPPGLAERATSLALEGADGVSVAAARRTVLDELGALYARWKTNGFTAVHAEIVALDYLKGRHLRIVQTDDDCAPVCGVADGIMNDGSLSVGGRRVYAGEAHVEDIA